MWLIESECSLASAHKLPKYNGPCRRFHGHTWRVAISVSCYSLDRQGIGVDFSTIKKKYDHRNFNDYDESPTAERMAVLIWKLIKSDMERRRVRGKIQFVRVWESDKSCVTLKALAALGEEKC